MMTKFKSGQYQLSIYKRRSTIKFLIKHSLGVKQSGVLVNVISFHDLNVPTYK